MKYGIKKYKDKYVVYRKKWFGFVTEYYQVSGNGIGSWHASKNIAYIYWNYFLIDETEMASLIVELLTDTF